MGSMSRPIIYIRKLDDEGRIRRCEILDDGSYIIEVIRGEAFVHDRTFGPGTKFLWCHKDGTTSGCAPWSGRNGTQPVYEIIDEPPHCPECDDYLDGDDYLCSSCRSGQSA
jgi:hypothetical protein